MPGGIKRKTLRRQQMKLRRSLQTSGHEIAPIVEGFRTAVLTRKVLDSVGSRNFPTQGKAHRYTQGPALTWANISRLPNEEIATRIALKYLKANIDHKWPRQVNSSNFEREVQRPLLGGAVGFDGRPINTAWITEITPQKILAQAKIDVANAARWGETITIKDALEKFWTRRSASGFRGLTKAEGLSAVRFMRNSEKRRAQKLKKAA